MINCDSSGMEMVVKSWDFPGFDYLTWAAWHEAGHAIAGLILGFGISYVKIMDSACGVGFTGRTGIIRPRDLPCVFTKAAYLKWKRWQLLRDIEATCAGCAAETIRFPEMDDFGRNPYLSGSDDGDDYQVARREAYRLASLESGSAEPDELAVTTIIFDALDRVKKRLRSPENWRAVVELAELLIERRRAGLEAGSIRRAWTRRRRGGSWRSGMT